MIEIEEVLYRWQKGVSKRKIAKGLSISRNKVMKIIEEAERQGLSQNEGEGESGAMKEALRLLRQPGAPRLTPAQDALSQYHTQIAEWLQMPYMTTTQMFKLLKEVGNKGSERSLRRYLQKHFPEAPKSTVHLETIPGQQAQVDYGYVGVMVDPASQKKRKADVFIMTLSHSRYRFVRFVFNQDIETWVDCHIRAFHFFGGVPATIMPDNLKTGIIKAEIYDPVINRTYGELERYYGFVCDPTKVRTPEHKGKVERNMQIVRQQVLAGRIFRDSEEANEAALKWCRYEIALQVTRTTGRTPWDLFIAEEKDKLHPLPIEDYDCALWQELKVHRDHHIVFEGSYYSVPTRYIGTLVWVRANKRMVDIYLDTQKIKTHARAQRRGEWITDKQDYPKGARIFLDQDKDYCLTQAQHVGPSTHQLLEQVLHVPTLVGQRKAQAILRLSDTYGLQRLEAACTRALAFGNDTYHSLKNILARGLDAQHMQGEALVELVQLGKQTCYARSPHEFQPIAQGGLQ